MTDMQNSFAVIPLLLSLHYNLQYHLYVLEFVWPSAAICIHFQRVGHPVHTMNSYTLNF